MARPTLRVRSKITGHTALISPNALRHFPDYEPVDAAPEPAPTESGPPHTEPAKPSTRRSTAAKNSEEE